MFTALAQTNNRHMIAVYHIGDAVCVCLCILVYTCVYWCIPVYTDVYLCTLVYTCVYLCILVHIECIYVHIFSEKTKCSRLQFIAMIVSHILAVGIPALLWYLIHPCCIKKKEGTYICTYVRIHT